MTISDKKLAVASTTDPNLIAYYNADVVTANDYYPFGMAMPGRDFTTTGKKSRHSINGQERSDELNDNLTTALYWEYDSRIGRRWNLDPAPTVGVSDYAAFLNNPIWRTDVHGDTPTVKEAALMCQNGYDKFDPNNKVQKGLADVGWNRIEKVKTNVFNPGGKGKAVDVSLDDIGATFKFNVAMYSKTVNGKAEYAFANAGTADGVDIGSDVRQIGGNSSQYLFSMVFAQSLKAGMGGREMTYVGHSLGGGLAATNALATGSAAITFNPQGISAATRIGYGLPAERAGQIKSFVVGGELIDRSQRLLGSRANGTITYIHPQAGVISSGAALYLRYSTDIRPLT